MNQKTKKVNTIFFRIPWKQKSWWVFTALQFIFTFVPIYLFLGFSLWFQAFLLSSLILATLGWVFFQFIQKMFKGSPLKGYDPWHLRPLLDQRIPQLKVQITSHDTPLCFQYEFYGQSYMVLSSSLLSHLQKNELTQLLKFQQLYFKNGFAKFFTQLTYLMFILYSPFLFISLLFKKLRISFVEKLLEALFKYSLFIPFSIIARSKFFQLDSIAFKNLDKDSYCNLLQKLQTYWQTSSTPFPLVFSCLFFTNPKALSTSYFHMQPSTQKRILKLMNRINP